jgi:hypothetical protein
VIDIGRDDAAAARHLLAHEFRRDKERHRRAEALAVFARGLRGFEHFFAAEIFALGDVDHFLGDDSGARPFELSQGVRGTFPSPLWGGVRGGGGVRLARRPPSLTLPRKGGGNRNAAHRPRRVRETPREMLAAGIAVVDRLDRPAVVVLDAAARLHPFDARAL